MCRAPSVCGFGAPGDRDVSWSERMGGEDGEGKMERGEVKWPMSVVVFNGRDYWPFVSALSHWAHVRHSIQSTQTTTSWSSWQRGGGGVRPPQSVQGEQTMEGGGAASRGYRVQVLFGMENQGRKGSDEKRCSIKARMGCRTPPPPPPHTQTRRFIDAN